ncbi:MAG TPA: VIT domain-containing protein [Drouetiella sp.]
MTTQILMLDSVETTKHCRILGSVHVIKENKKFSLPLSAVSISAKVAERLAHVTVKETFKNPHSEHLEAVYIFPLAGGCAVSSFEMKVGDRSIVGKVAERQKARQEYVQAIHDGKRAALLEQERDDVFTVQVGNLPPGEEVTVLITYSEKLPYFDNGTTEIRLPLVVTPRYIPGEALDRDSVGDGTELDTDLVPDASRITPPRLAPGVDPKTSLQLSVELAGEQTIEDLSCSQHATKTGLGKDGVKVSLSREDELLNRDFVLRWRVTTGELQSNLIVFKAKEAATDGFAMLSLLPPKTNDIASPPRDVLFIVDRSGSMKGTKMASAARACSLLIATLGPKDRFGVQAFDDSREWLEQSKSRFIDADESGKESGDKYLRTITARGGTEMFYALKDAIVEMNARKDKKRRLPVIVVLTDGEVGNESHILKQVQQDLSDIRLFTVGIDTAVNSGFLQRIASVGGGTSTFVTPGTQLEDALASVGREIGAPLVTDIKLADVNIALDKKSIAPNKISDLFEGRATTAFFKFDAAGVKDLQKAKVRVSGKHVDGSSFNEEVQAKVVDMPAISQLWAKTQIAELEDQYRISSFEEQERIHNQIVELSVDHSLLTRFTAFVVVDEAEIVNAGGDVRKVVQPVHTPAQWVDANTVETGFSRARYGAAAPSAAPAAGSWGSAPASFGAPPPGFAGGSSSYGSPPLRKMQMFQQNTGMELPDESETEGAAFAPQAVPPQAPPSVRQASPTVSASAPKAAPLPTPPADAPLPPPDASNAPARSETVAESIKRKLNSLANFGRADKGSQPPTPENDETDGAWMHEENVRYPTQGEQEVINEEIFIKAWRKFAAALQQSFDMIQSGAKPNVDAVEEARTELLKALANAKSASKRPLLQKYLRSGVVRLITAIESAGDASDALKAVAKQQDLEFKAVQNEYDALRGMEKPFWRNV